MAHFEEAFKTTRPTVTESVMEPLSEFASEFDRLAFAAMQALKNRVSMVVVMKHPLRPKGKPTIHHVIYLRITGLWVVLPGRSVSLKSP